MILVKSVQDKEGAFVGLLFSLYLLALQLFVIDATCVWCLANDVVVAPLLAALTAVRLRS